MTDAFFVFFGLHELLEGSLGGRELVSFSFDPVALIFADFEAVIFISVDDTF